ncbi:transglutaminase-like cysteine peptidase [Microvirga tunisiensis]|uniref:Transglutaminase n=1 Tax=Microvirga tunisiensis TaxID=2108360 RepID=A0A5N7MVH2_9HYPH|nr:transglutaminase-like cysteine peptidase [Microvirga tunisiensis]MPR13068.1 transglutaminase [Microvirga tunisiensis]MPR30957.1 transglutaminase [Microvirga tunisiensis]
MDHVDQAISTHLDLSGGTRRSALKAALICTALAALASTASAESLLPVRATSPIQVVGPAGPTHAWIRFCESHPYECRVDLSQPARISLNPQVWATLTQVNERVNSTILAVTDQDHWGVLDRWDYPDDGLGDCEDIQLLKRKLLVGAGLPQRAMRMAAVIDERGQGHAVLMVLTDRGDFILDKRNAILPWRRTGYAFIKREGTNGRSWVALGDQPAPFSTANR